MARSVAALCSSFVSVLILSQAFRTGMAADAQSRDMGNEVRQERGRCTGHAYIEINQGHFRSLENEESIFLVRISNFCIQSGCEVSNLRVSCSSFESSLPVDPAKLKKIDDKDCVVNAGNPMKRGESIAFFYANSTPFNFTVSSATYECDA
ncbi:hypothetical protein KP509_23G064600 [Ceratopteris richardii]|uniref:Uncharacterized protein n=1 Tax=Ceratopteris richardii TaxID=49495 RepID=A0A8T2S2K3_CERRI|nr:hypothetical protein KP509_23G064600 [Ceratopteris richardii]